MTKNFCRLKIFWEIGIIFESNVFDFLHLDKVCIFSQFWKFPFRKTSYMYFSRSTFDNYLELQQRVLVTLIINPFLLRYCIKHQQWLIQFCLPAQIPLPTPNVARICFPASWASRWIADIIILYSITSSKPFYSINRWSSNIKSSLTSFTFCYRKGSCQQPEIGLLIMLVILS